MAAPFLEVENLCKHFGELRAVDGDSFNVSQDEMVGLIGPNGAGKTTLIRLITGILKPTSGKVRFKGEDITGQATAKIVNKGIAPTFQVVKPFRHLPVAANVMVSCLCPRAKRKGDWVKTVELRTCDALEFCGIADIALEPASAISHGDLKRLEVARQLPPSRSFFFPMSPLVG